MFPISGHFGGPIQTRYLHINLLNYEIHFLYAQRNFIPGGKLLFTFGFSSKIIDAVITHIAKNSNNIMKSLLYK